jgi:hypothetical protein
MKPNLNKLKKEGEIVAQSVEFWWNELANTIDEIDSGKLSDEEGRKKLKLVLAKNDFESRKIAELTRKLGAKWEAHYLNKTIENAQKG